MVWWYWLIAACMFLLSELSNPGLFLFLSFACGAFAGALASFMEYSFAVQVVIAALVTVVSLVILMWWVKGQLHGFNKDQHTNMYALVGKRGYIFKEVPVGGFGQVKMSGELWACRSLHQEQIKCGQEVEVVQVTGSHVVVKKVVTL